MTTNNKKIKASDPSHANDGISMNPNALIDTLIAEMCLKNDAALSRKLVVTQSVISKVRHNRVPVTASLLLRMHDISGRSVRELRIMMNDRRDKFSPILAPNLHARRLRK